MACSHAQRQAAPEALDPSGNRKVNPVAGLVTVRTNLVGEARALIIRNLRPDATVTSDTPSGSGVVGPIDGWITTPLAVLRGVDPGVLGVRGPLSEPL